MASQAGMTGTRLEFVVVEIPGTVKRAFHKMVATQIKPRIPGDKPRTMYELKKVYAEVPGGFMVYCPRGHAVRLKDKAALKQYKVNRTPTIINLEGLNDPNSPLGKLMMAQDKEGRVLAMAVLEKQVIALATRRSGANIICSDEEAMDKMQEAA